MRTVAQKQRRARILKAGCALIIAAVLFTPKLDNVELPFPLVSGAVASQIE